MEFNLHLNMELWGELVIVGSLKGLQLDWKQ